MNIYFGDDTQQSRFPDEDGQKSLMDATGADGTKNDSRKLGEPNA